MNEANVIPLFPGRVPEMHMPTNPAHLPCPDLPCYSLNQEQKSRGLKCLAKVRDQLKNRELNPLREECKALFARGKKTADKGERLRLYHEVQSLRKKAKRMNQRWS